MDVLPQFVPDRRSSRTLTEQLVDGVHAAIASGALTPGDVLPPTRKLAASLGVSRSVVVSAYEQLVGENLLEATPGSGTRVTAYEASRAPAGPRAHDPDQRPASGASVSGAPIIDLRSGLPFVAPEPPRAWSRALASAARSPWSSQSPDPRGTPALRTRLAAHTRLHRGLSCSGDDVVVTSGTSEALVLITLALRRTLRRAPLVAVEDPGYRSGSDALEAAGAEIVPLAVGRRGASADSLAALHAGSPVDAVMLTPSHQFPLGGSLAEGERDRILQWALEHRVLIIEDDYDSEFRHAGPALPALAASDKHGVVAYVASLNKILSPSLRCGMLVLPSPGPLRDALLWVRESLGATVSAYTQTALAEFIGSGAFARAVARNKREYAHRRAAVLAEFAGLGVEVFASEGGLHLVAKTPTAAGAAQVAALLREQGILVETIADFSLLRPEGGIVFGYGAGSMHQLLHAVRLIAETIIGLPQFEGSGIPIR
ncbi:MocR-like pyridoxine biosynthesis transcription factor PdxR [Leucobacter salsicius]|uniref:MocR-like pyridoxine biosynthesis transcription factor PdxR n=1 Tax=Leucobacter salsicius TaxID=664638 RepID=UPI000349E51A|nr:PLP-dependent aminotransferase family protein [Leucobacter salsicius]